MIAQHQSFFMCAHPHLSIEEVASCKVEQGECIVINWIMLEIDPMVNFVFELADSHVVNRTVPIKSFGKGDMVSDKLFLL